MKNSKTTTKETNNTAVSNIQNEKKNKSNDLQTILSDLSISEKDNNSEQFEKINNSKPIQKKSFASQINNSNKNQTALPNNVQQKMENSFQQDFSNVDIKTNSKDAQNMNALAFTQGNSVHFAPGQFSPNTKKGQELIGHEFAHVVQQRQGRVKPTSQMAKFKLNDSSSLENEADLQGSKAARWEASTTTSKKPTFSTTINNNTAPIQRTTSDKELKKHKDNVDNIIDGIIEGQVVNESQFNDITYETWHTSQGTAKKAIRSQLEKLKKELPSVVVSNKNQLTLYTLTKKEDILNAQKHFYILRGMAKAWFEERGDDPERAKRVYGYEKFIEHVDDLMLMVDIQRKQIGVSDEDVAKNFELASKDEKLNSITKHYQQRSAKSIFTNLGKAVGEIAPDPWSKGSIEANLEIPIEPTGIGYLGGRFFIEAERDDSSFTTHAEFALKGGAKVTGVFKVEGQLGGYMEAKGASPEQAMKLISYGFYKRMKQSKIFSGFADFAWGGATSAQKFANTTEEEAFGSGKGIDDAYVELGAYGAAKGEIGNSDVVSGSAEIKGMTGTRFDKDTTKGAKGKSANGFAVTLAVSSGIASGEVSYARQWIAGQLAKSEVSASVNSTKIPNRVGSILGIIQTVIGKAQEAAQKGEEKAEQEQSGLLSKGYDKTKIVKEQYDIFTGLEGAVTGNNELIPTPPGTSDTSSESGADGGLDISIGVDFLGKSGYFQLSSLTKYALNVGVLSTEASYKSNMFRIIYDGGAWKVKVVNQE